MIKELKGTPDTMIGFVASDEVTKEDFDKIVMPAVDDLVKRTDKLNYLIVLDTPISKFKIGDWLREVMLKLNNLNKWNRAAIVTDVEGMKSLTELFSNVIPGHVKAFTHDQMESAINWAGELSGFNTKHTFQKLH